MMPIYEVKNKKTGTVLGRLEVDDPTKILEALAESSGATIEEIASSFGNSIEEAKKALVLREIVAAEPPRKRAVPKTSKLPLPPRRFSA